MLVRGPNPEENSKLYLASSGGSICCCNLQTGESRVIFDLNEHVETETLLVSSPSTVEEATHIPCRSIYVGITQKNIDEKGMLFCLKEAIVD
jgi:hypothetical protein